MDLVVLIYNLTRTFPDEEKFGLVSQMRRAAVSIPSNIAEGFGRRNNKDNARFVGIAFGSAMELETQLIICQRLNYFDMNTSTQVVYSFLDQVLRILYAYRRSLQ
jgi:S23 ribosomal protein.